MGVVRPLLSPLLKDRPEPLLWLWVQCTPVANRPGAKSPDGTDEAAGAMDPRIGPLRLPHAPKRGLSGPVAGQRGAR